MSNRKQRREIDRAIAHLMQFQAETAPWDALMSEFLSQMFAPLARRYEISVDDAERRIMADDYDVMAYGYLFEELATARWDGAASNMIDAYLKQRGWREGSHGRRYLRALGESELALWEVVVCTPGVSVDIRAYGSQDKPMRVKEQAASHSLHPWDCIAARVLRVDGQPMFAGGLLGFTPAQAVIIERTLASAAQELKDTLVAGQNAGEIEHLPDDLHDSIEREVRDQLADVAFTVWASAIVDAQDRAPPRLVNRDDEPIELMRQRFPITGDRAAIEQALRSSPLLSEHQPGSWIWCPQPVEGRGEGERASIHGHLWLAAKALELESYSANRAERGRAFILSLAGEHLGEPLTVHESLDTTLAAGDRDSEPENDLNALPEVQAMLQDQLTAHYRQTLDEPIPMLQGATPRACAADPERRQAVIAWLKVLENSDHRSPSAGYDFAWMWQALGLERE